MNYGQIKSQFVALMNRTDLRSNTALQTTFMQQGIVRVSRTLRVPAMEKAVNVTIGATFDGLTIPNDLLQLINIETPTADEVVSLTRGQLSRVKTASLQSGTPRKYARQGNIYHIGPAPAEGDTIRIDYYSDAGFTALVDDTDSNIMTTVAWDAILYAALTFAADYWTDARLPGWEARYTQIMEDLDAQGDNDELTADSAVGPAYEFPSDE